MSNKMPEGVEIEALFNGHPYNCDREQWAHLGDLLEDGDEIKILAVKF